MRKYKIWLLLFVLLLIIIGAGWYGIKLGSDSIRKKKKLVESGSKYGEVEKIEKIDGVGISQSIVDQEERVIYYLEGSFSEKIHLFDNGSMYGYFVVSGDVNQRKFKVNTADSKMYVGVYDNSDFVGDVDWSFVSNDVLEKLIIPGDPIILRMTQEFGKNPAVDDYYLYVQDVLKELKEDIVSGKNEYEIPLRFNFTPTSMGVVQ